MYTQMNMYIRIHLFVLIYLYIYPSFEIFRRKKKSDIDSGKSAGSKIQAEFLMSWLSCRQPHSTLHTFTHSNTHPHIITTTGF